MCRQEVYWEAKKARHPAYMDMSAEFTFLGQFLPELAMRIGQLPMLAHLVVVHVGVSVVHALQRCQDLKGYKKSPCISVQLKRLSNVSLLKTRHRCCAPIPALGD
jgi:hypothetical protein